MDLIDRQAAIDAVRSYYDEFDEREESIEERIERLPSADIDLSRFSDKLWRAAYERGKSCHIALNKVPTAQGRWEYVDYGGVGNYHCSRCRAIGKKDYEFCPRCGARMDG